MWTFIPGLMSERAAFQLTMNEEALQNVNQMLSGVESTLS